MNVTQAQLEALHRKYHLYDGVASETTPEIVLKMAHLDVTVENIAGDQRDSETESDRERGRGRFRIG